MMEKTEEKTYIQDAFRYLVANTGSCGAKYHDMGEYASYAREPHWTVHINGRLFVETRPECEDEYHFQCKTTSGTVKISFSRK